MITPTPLPASRLAIIGAWAPHRSEDAIARAARRAQRIKPATVRSRWTGTPTRSTALGSRASIGSDPAVTPVETVNDPAG